MITNKMIASLAKNWNVIDLSNKLQKYANKMPIFLGCLSVRPAHHSAAARGCGRFAAVGPSDKRYRSIATRPALSIECEQCHVVSWRWTPNTDLLAIAFVDASPHFTDSTAGRFTAWWRTRGYLERDRLGCMALLHRRNVIDCYRLTDWLIVGRSRLACIETCNRPPSIGHYRSPVGRPDTDSIGGFKGPRGHASPPPNVTPNNFQEKSSGVSRMQETFG